MKKLLTFAATGLISTAALLATATPALADHPRVDFSISLGAPVYGPPVGAFVPQPLYAGPAVYPGAVPYSPAYDYRRREWEERRWRERRWRERQWREQRWREHEWREHEWRERHSHPGYGY